MVCADHETRVGAHRIFSVVLVPSSVCPRPLAATPHTAKKNPIGRTLSRTVSVFSSSAALFEKLKERSHSQEKISHETKDNAAIGEEAKINNGSMLNRLKSKFSSKRHSAASTESLGTEEAKVNNHPTMNRLKSTLSRTYSIKMQPSTTTADTTAPSVPDKESVGLLVPLFMLNRIFLIVFCYDHFSSD